MNKTAAPFRRPIRNITWLPQRPLLPCVHQYGPVVDDKGVTTQRCLKCGEEETP
jgi:hypothetical protein